MNNYLNLPTVNYLKNNNIDFKIIHLTSIAKTVRDVEQLYGCSIKQILKTLVLITDEEPIVAVLQGDKKISLEKIKSIFDLKEARLANPKEVFDITGYEIGGVSPFGIKEKVNKIIDESAFQEEKLNFGAGTQYIGIEISSNDLKKVWDGKIDSISL